MPSALLTRPRVAELAVAAANSPRRKWCLTVTDADGFAIGHGCARLGAGDRGNVVRLGFAAQYSQLGTASLAELPSQVSLATIPISALRQLADSTVRPSARPAQRPRPVGGASARTRLR